MFPPFASAASSVRSVSIGVPSVPAGCPIAVPATRRPSSIEGLPPDLIDLPEGCVVDATFMSAKALSAFLDEQIKIKAEEVIHQLNENPDQVIIKRKVFIGKRDKKSVMEVIFGYKGRLYFHAASDGKVEVLAIGTKNTQARELEYLAKL